MMRSVPRALKCSIGLQTTSSLLAGVLFISSAVALCWLLVWRFNHGVFTADGVHYFQAIRNLGSEQHGWNLFDPGLFENLLGNHTYFVLYLFAPIIWLFPSPLVMGIISLASHLVSALLIRRILKHLWPQRIWLSMALPFVYLWSPFGLRLATSEEYLLQPDVLLAPFAFAMVYGLIRRRWKTSLLMFTLILVTKEEYLVTGPVLLMLSILLFELRPPKQFQIWAISIWVVLAGIVLFARHSFANRNQFQVVTVDPEIWRVLEWTFALPSLLYGLVLVLPLVLLALLLWRQLNWQRLLILIACALVIVSRNQLNLIHYARPSTAMSFFHPQTTAYVLLFVAGLSTVGLLKTRYLPALLLSFVPFMVSHLPAVFRVQALAVQSHRGPIRYEIEAASEKLRKRHGKDLIVASPRAAAYFPRWNVVESRHLADSSSLIRKNLDQVAYFVETPDTRFLHLLGPVEVIHSGPRVRIAIKKIPGLKRGRVLRHPAQIK